MCALLVICTAKILFGLCGVSSSARAPSPLPWPAQTSWRATGCKRMVEEEYGLAARGDKDCHQLVALGELRAAKGKEKQSY